MSRHISIIVVRADRARARLDVRGTLTRGLLCVTAVFAVSVVWNCICIQHLQGGHRNLLDQYIDHFGCENRYHGCIIYIYIIAIL